MKIAPLADVKARLSAYLDEVEKEGPLIITRSGKPVAVLLAPTDDEDLERLVLARSPRFLALLGKARASVRSGRGLTGDEVWTAVGARHTAQSREEPGKRSRARKKQT